MSIHQVSKIDLSKDVVDCIVFWTKNPRPILKKLDLLNDYPYYFQFTLNSYDKSLEPNVPEKKQLIKTFIDLSNYIGKERVIWRYDPIILTEKFTPQYHYKWFEYLAQRLSQYTEKCVISFVDLYKKSERNLKGVNLYPISKEVMEDIAYHISNIASKYGLIIESCSELIDLDKYNIKHGKCIDAKLISALIGKRLIVDKDPTQRDMCGCVKSIDIGTYNSCKHHCLYCYANFNRGIVNKNTELHSINSPLLFGELDSSRDVIHNREMISLIDNQYSLLDGSIEW